VLRSTTQRSKLNRRRLIIANQSVELILTHFNSTIQQKLQKIFDFP
jgi:hypothetical protein